MKKKMNFLTQPHQQGEYLMDLYILAFHDFIAPSSPQKKKRNFPSVFKVNSLITSMQESEQTEN